MRIGALECCSRGHRNGIEVEVEDEFGSLSELEDFLVVSFYKFVCIKDPEAEVSKHLAFLQVLSIFCDFLRKIIMDIDHLFRTKKNYYLQMYTIFFFLNFGWH